MNKEVKEICLKCEHNIHCQGKGCAFRSLSNDYCDEVENANNLIKNLQQKVNQLETNRDELKKYILEDSWSSVNGEIASKMILNKIAELERGKE
jgi:predicted transcriptional regulator